jgi:hypothetical protein
VFQFRKPKNNFLLHCLPDFYEIVHILHTEYLQAAAIAYNALSGRHWHPKDFAEICSRNSGLKSMFSLHRKWNP